jgi:hypothetical protein
MYAYSYIYIYIYIYHIVYIYICMYVYVFILFEDKHNIHTQKPTHTNVYSFCHSLTHTSHITPWHTHTCRHEEFRRQVRHCLTYDISKLNDAIGWVPDALLAKNSQFVIKCRQSTARSFSDGPHWAGYVAKNSPFEPLWLTLTLTHANNESQTHY